MSGSQDVVRDCEFCNILNCFPCAAVDLLKLSLALERACGT